MSVRKNERTAESVLVIGLGRFGSAVAVNLVQMGKEVLAIDEDERIVQRWSSELTHVVQADTTDEDALRQLGVASYDRAVVAIGSDIEASILTVLALSEAGVQQIWAKANTLNHAEILRRVGAQHVVLPEQAMGQRMAHMLISSMDEYLEFEGGYAMAKITAPVTIWGVPLVSTDVRKRYRITVVGYKRKGEDFTYAEPNTVVHEGDELIISGQVRDLEEFSALPNRKLVTGKAE